MASPSPPPPAPPCPPPPNHVGGKIKKLEEDREESIQKELKRVDGRRVCLIAAVPMTNGGTREGGLGRGTRKLSAPEGDEGRKFGDVAIGNRMPRSTSHLSPPPPYFSLTGKPATSSPNSKATGRPRPSSGRPPRSGRSNPSPSSFAPSGRGGNRPPSASCAPRTELRSGRRRGRLSGPYSWGALSGVGRNWPRYGRRGTRPRRMERGRRGRPLSHSSAAVGERSQARGVRGRDRGADVVSALERERASLSNHVSSLQLQLANAPCQVAVDKMRHEQLRVFKRLEYNALNLDRDPNHSHPERTPPAVIDQDDDPEAILVAKLRKVEAELVHERREKSEGNRACDDLARRLASIQESLRSSEDLVRCDHRPDPARLAPGRVQARVTGAGLGVGVTQGQQRQAVREGQVKAAEEEEEEEDRPTHGAGAAGGGAIGTWTSRRWNRELGGLSSVDLAAQRGAGGGSGAKFRTPCSASWLLPLVLVPPPPCLSAPHSLSISARTRRSCWPCLPLDRLFTRSPDVGAGRNVSGIHEAQDHIQG
ncbi:hypothetical protein ACHAWF_001952, partial [Thalassiosira exigua]